MYKTKTYSQQFQWKKEVEYYRKITEVEKDNWEAYHYLGQALLKLEQWPECVTAYQNALKLNPNLPGIHQKIGDALQQQAKAEKTNLLNYYKQKIQQNPD
ncbi:tetratricopeptide repeat protein, partial [Okeania sp. SIO1F9]